MLLLQGVTLSIGGIPLIYLGEEWAMLNDYDFVKDPAKAGDTRWVHRPKMRWEFLAELDDSIETGEGSIRKQVFRTLQKMIAVRKSSSAFAGQSMDLVKTNNPHLLGFVRYHESHRLIVIANFSEDPQVMTGNSIRTAGMGRFFEDLLTNTTYPTSDDLEIAPYQILWLSRV
jgi:amylosucrase